jgi:NADH-quinone oxidoreductase subunit A
MNPYLPVLFILAFGAVFGTLMSLMAKFLGPRKATAVKQQVFECGVSDDSSRVRMSVKFYMTAILFILFDIETIFLFLWARTFQILGWFGFIEILVFMVILIVGYIYVVKSGALEWD